MAKLTTTVCDICQRVKGETNHWFKVSPPNAYSQCVSIFDANVNVGDPYQDVCSSKCLHTIIDRITSNWNAKPNEDTESETRLWGNGLTYEDNLVKDE